MKKLLCLSLAVLILFAFSACSSPEQMIGEIVFLSSILMSDDSVPKEDIIDFVNEHKDELLECADKNDFSSFEGVGIVKNVYQAELYTELYCGGRGLSVSGYYCGFFYSPTDNEYALSQGDEYYSEKIFDNFYFYECTYY